MKKAWDSHKLCPRCKKTRTKNEHCAKCAPIVKRESKVDSDGLTKKERESYIRRAKEQYEEEGSVEIDDNALLSVGMDKGVYVQAWVWVYDED
jgi:hypothetical protein